MAAKRNKTQARRNAGNGGGNSGWVWGALGLVLGVVLILIVPRYLKRDGDDFFRPKPNPDAQPAPVTDEPDAVDAAGEATGDAPAKTADAKPAKKPDFDFYTMLPGKEVPLSDAELAATAEAEARREAQKQVQPAAAAPAPATTPPAGAASTPTPLPAPVDTSPAAPATTPVAPATPAVPAATASGSAPAPAVTGPPTPAAEAREPRYLLQAGAFEASGQAEELKAKIAMLGLGARVEAAKISGKTVYRVRMGPYGRATDLAEAKRKLSSGGQQAIAIKVQ